MAHAIPSGSMTAPLYAPVFDAGAVADVLGGAAVLKRAVSTLRDLDELVARGLPLRTLRLATERAAANPREARRLRDAIVPSASRKRRTTRLTPSESGRVERMARVVALAEYVLEDGALAREWLAREHPLLGGSPIDLARTELGARTVESLLWDLELSLPV
jgi:putative toxin-antitoxin system antitoxin component (TIGR02293 family)